ncbi:MAG: DUF362 domain-containing protein [Syntrophales bacterium LBB04]|nr:DUF362 domain-containing protein [Syntrophales bacterium LBB04]
MAKIIVRKAAYNYESLKPLVFEIMDALGGSEVIKDRKRVLIKPNLLIATKPDDAVLTHYLLVKAVSEYVLEKGAWAQVSDSPALGTFRKIIRDSGIKDALQGLNVQCSEFKESLPVDIGAPFGIIDLARDAMEAEVIINLPKLKTHDQMLLTLAVKNMFGCVVGLRKPEWHMKMDTNREMFARLIVQICRQVKPTFTILDGILAMEGEGPGKRGVPRPLGVIIAGRDEFAVDAAVCRMLGLKPDLLPTLKAAQDLGFLEETMDIDGALPEIRDFKFPNIAPLISGPRRLRGFIRRRLLQRPVCDQGQCLLCGKCRDFCPAQAIVCDEKPLAFDYERCIRCYCCIEVCPEGALHNFEPIAGRILGKIIRRNK